MGAFQAKWLRSEMVPPIVAASQEVRTRYTPLSTVKNWQEYFTTLSEYNSSSLFVDSSFKILPSHSSDPTALEAWRGFKLISGKLWRPLTVINALEKLYPDIATRESLTIHWLNAMRPDVTTVVTLQGVLHHFPALKKLHVTLFYDVLEGRQLIGYCGPHETTKEYNFNGKTLIRTVIGHNYDHFDKFFSSPDYTQPDLHVSFHSIFLGREDWKWMPPIKFVVKEKFKIVFTVHSASKWQEEVAIIKKMGGKLIDEGGPNVWKNIVPRVDLLTVEDPYSLIEPHSWYYITGEKEG
jgi:splicing suppressor protein 51